ncbi:MAG: LptE family protein [Paludibacteraceae bacterium]|nr:LptE family protein [Paludibacteraceae bacterium]
MGNTLRKSIILLLLATTVVIMPSCLISYKFNGASIDYTKTKSISIADFPNNAALVNPNLSNALSEGIRDIYSRQTRLMMLPKNGDMELEGEIIDYTLTPMAISADTYAAETKLTLTIRVRFTNNKAPEENFEKTYSAFQIFSSTRLLTEVQDDLCAAMIIELSENIYNDTVARW